MRPLEALDLCMQDAGLSRAALARSVGRNDSFVRCYYAKGMTPSVDTYRMLVEPCGYDLLLRNRENGKEIVITAENKDSVERHTD